MHERWTFINEFIHDDANNDDDASNNVEHDVYNIVRHDVGLNVGDVTYDTPSMG
jgi:hypothetical protein